MAIDPDTSIGAVQLNVADLDRAQDFYERVLGLRTLEHTGDAARLGVDGAPLIELAGEPDAPRRPPGSTGLFHLAILLPSRRDLARALRRLAEERQPLSGASDHLVSEALYLRDPEGNGIEIYRDRPREEWSKENGKIRMATLPLDLESVSGELNGAEAATGAPADTRVGHVHLQVADLDAAHDFYEGLLGFDISVDDYPGALFLSAGGYHHHIGLNTWAGEGAPPPPPGSLGMRRFEIALPRAEEIDEIAGRLEAAGVDFERGDEGLSVADPSGNGVLIRAGR